jgi:hypothetical protein
LGGKSTGDFLDLRDVGGVVCIKLGLELRNNLGQESAQLSLRCKELNVS